MEQQIWNNFWDEENEDEDKIPISSTSNSNAINIEQREGTKSSPNFQYAILDVIPNTLAHLKGASQFNIPHKNLMCMMS